jgi:hypothetical protein
VCKYYEDNIYTLLTMFSSLLAEPAELFFLDFDRNANCLSISVLKVCLGVWLSVFFSAVLSKKQRYTFLFNRKLDLDN